MISSYLIILTLKVFLVTWFITNFGPIQDVIHSWFKYSQQNFWQEQAYNIITCHTCLSMWTVLLVTWNPFLAIGASFLANLTSKK